MSVEWGNVAEWVGGLGTTGALVFAGYQALRLFRQTQEDRKLEIDGVALSWAPDVAPRGAEHSDGTADWRYTFELINPGRFSISNICVEVYWPVDVRRVRFDGHLEEPTKRLVLETPVVLGGRVRPWKRKVRFPYSDAAKLKHTKAVVRFVDAQGNPRKTEWPVERHDK